MNNIIKRLNRKSYCSQCGDCIKTKGMHETEDDLFYICKHKGLINISEQIFKCKYYKRNPKFLTYNGSYKISSTSYHEKGKKRVTIFYKYKKGKWSVKYD